MQRRSSARSSRKRDARISVGNAPNEHSLTLRSARPGQSEGRPIVRPPLWLRPMRKRTNLVQERGYGAFVFAFCATHLPNAFDFVLFVPYFALKAAAPEARSVLHCFAAAVSASSDAWFKAVAFAATHFPKAFLPLPVP